MTSNKKTARIAGLLYLGVVITGIHSLMYVPKKLIAWDNAATTFNNIASNQSLYRAGIVSGLLCYTFFLFLPIILYKLFKPVNDTYAKLMVLLAVVSVPMYFINVQNQFTVLSLVSSSNYLNGFSTEQIKSMVMLYLDHYENGMRTIHIFSGLWLFPFGYLVFKSGFLPKILGLLLMLGCFGYLINFLGNTLIEDYFKIGISFYFSLPASIGEIGICLWLLIMGTKDKPAQLLQ
jgi:Domain of unknown function (DUF4386)